VALAGWQTFPISRVFVSQFFKESLAEVSAFFLGTFKIVFSGVFALTFLVAIVGFFAVRSISLRVFAFSLTISLGIIIVFTLPT